MDAGDVLVWIVWVLAALALLSSGLAVVLFSNPFYSALALPWTADLLADQRLGGGIAWATGELPLLVVLIAQNRDFYVGYKENYKEYRDYVRNFVEYATGDRTYDQYVEFLDGQALTDGRVAALLRHDAAGKDASVYVFADQPAVYVRSSMEPASRYVVYYHLRWDDARKPETIDQVTTTAPKYIVAQGPRVEDFPEIEKIMREQYSLMATEGNLVVYKRR